MNKPFCLALGLVVASFSAQLAHAETPRPPKWMDTPVKEMVGKVRASTKQVPITDLKAALDLGDDIVVLDVREPNENAAAHIPEAINLPRGMLEFAVWSLVPDTQQAMYVYCKTAAPEALATRQLNDLGYRNAVAVDTGAAEWVRAGYPIQTSITEEEVIILPAMSRGEQ